ncbi:MAG: PTS system mannose/fructose/sorbose family transporter subunit IID [Candidatus Goldbacteria bacterium]|nr:PTS system mannose/fructose/sorbose family transporter subunit IID [Candidatus Goldiibacteriota bacterium]
MKKINIFTLLLSGLKLNFLQAAWNFERLQNIGFLLSIYKILKIIYKNNIENLKIAIKRHLEFFNTHIFFSSAVLGMVSRLEEDLDNSDPEKKNKEIENAKIGVMGPLAAIGDSIFWSAIKPFALLTGIGYTYLMGFNADSLIYGSIISIIIYNIPRIFVKYYLLIKSYYDYQKLFTLLQQIKFQHLIKVIKITGMILLGVISAGYLYKKNLNFIPVRAIDNFLLVIIFILITLALKRKTSISNILIAIIVLSVFISYIIG